MKKKTTSIQGSKKKLSDLEKDIKFLKVQDQKILNFLKTWIENSGESFKHYMDEFKKLNKR